MTNYEYVVNKLQSGIFNFSVIAPMIGVSRKTLSKIAYGKSESPQQLTIDAIANFIRKIGD
jgi:DNA-binding XRE family transcriptional regulator